MRFGGPLPLLAILAALALCGCEASGNGPYGSFIGKPAAIVKVQRTHAVKTTEATATSPATCESDCSDGFCVLPPTGSTK